MGSLGREKVGRAAATGDAGRVVFILSLIGGLALLAFALLLLSPLAPTGVKREVVFERIYTNDPAEVNPEPYERFLYVGGVLLAPLCFTAACIGARRLATAPAWGAALRRSAPTLAWLSPPLVLLLVIAAGAAEGTGLVRNLTVGGALSAAVAVMAGGAVAWSGHLGERLRQDFRVPLIALAAFLLLAVFAIGVIGVEHIRNTPPFQFSFNAFFHSVVQVYLGKALLIDFSNQYGLYPHFLEPFFRVIGLSVYSFTTLMALLNLLTFACFYRFVAAETRDEVLAFFALATLLFFGYVSTRVGSWDLYLQYHPLRVLFPALALPLALRYARSPSARGGAVLAALGAAALLWNPDSGVAVLAAALSLPCYDALANRRFGSIPARLLGGIAAVAAVLGVFTAYLRLRYGHFPDYAQFLSPAREFYLAGLMMRPMPVFGRWVPVVAVYAVGLLRAVFALLDGNSEPRPRLYFFLSVVGLGAFTYYQGRSVIGNLFSSSYPAVILLALLADELRRALPPSGALPDRLLLGALAALLAFSVPALAAVSPVWAGKLGERLSVSRGQGDPGVMADVEFARTQLRPGGSVVILSHLSGLYHLVSRTTNPLPIPGDSELSLRKDFQLQSQYVCERRGPVVIDGATFSRGAIELFAQQAPYVRRSPGGTLVFLPGP